MTATESSTVATFVDVTSLFFPVSYREVEFQFKKDKKKKLELMLL
jgi:hypothetical protein